MYRMLEEAGAEDRDLTSVRLWLSGADAMPHELAARFKKRGATATLPLVGPLGEAMFAEGYGMVETAGGVAIRVSPPMVPASIGGTVGLPLPGVRFKVVDDRDAREEVGVDGIEVGQQQADELLAQHAALGCKPRELGPRVGAGGDHGDRELQAQRPTLGQLVQPGGGIVVDA